MKQTKGGKGEAVTYKLKFRNFWGGRSAPVSSTAVGRVIVLTLLRCGKAGISMPDGTTSCYKIRLSISISISIDC